MPRNLSESLNGKDKVLAGNERIYVEWGCSLKSSRGGMQS
jgi:hypothetical protein